MIQRESNVTRIVDKLVDRKWKSRETCPANRRKVDRRFTEAGRTVFRTASAAVMAFHSDMADRWQVNDIEFLSDLLDKLRDES